MQSGFNKIRNILETKQWLLDGWDLFKQKPFLWIGMIVLFAVFNGLSINIPKGQYLIALLAPSIVGGIYTALNKQHNNDAVGFTDMFSIFGNHALLKQCLIIGVIGMGVMFINYLIYKMPGSGYMLRSYSGNSYSSFGRSFSLGDFLTGILNLCWSIAAVFGVPLVVLKKMQAIPALKLSISAILSNGLPIFVFYGVVFALVFIAVIPFGLGLIVLLPVVICSVYQIFNSLFNSNTSSHVIQESNKTEKTLEDYKK